MVLGRENFIMEKKKKEKKSRSSAQKNKGMWIAGLVIILVIGWFTWGRVNKVNSARLLKGNLAASSGYVRRETSATLSPALFVGKTAAAYQVAQEIPDVLDQLYCYCECDKHMGHASLLSCFIDSHAAT